MFTTHIRARARARARKKDWRTFAGDRRGEDGRDLPRRDWHVRTHACMPRCARHSRRGVALHVTHSRHSRYNVSDPRKLEWRKHTYRARVEYRFDVQGDWNSNSWSEHGQDLYIDSLLKHKQNGFFVEMGAFDGESYSNTLFLERERHWSGLLIEPNKHEYQRLVGKGRRAYSANTCLSIEVTPKIFHLGGTVTTAHEYMDQQKATSIKEVLSGKYGDLAGAGAPANATTVVQCSRLAELLERIGTFHIDYFSLDVEGMLD